ncbi:MAG: hypothetical protein ACRERE_26525 [Candidatus Entotheonellia bacterium]
MHPPVPFCHTPRRPARGQRGQGHIRGHRPVEPRDRGSTGGPIFAATKGPPCSRVHTAMDLAPLGLTLLCHGCPLHAMVAALGRDERTGAAWLARAGRHGQHGHQHVVQQGQVDVPHVQADAWWVQLGGRRVWMAMATAGPSRLGLGGVISPHRAWRLSTTLVPLVRAGAHRRALLVCVAGLARDVTAVLRVLRHPGRTGRRGRPRLVLEHLSMLKLRARGWGESGFSQDFIASSENGRWSRRA